MHWAPGNHDAAPDTVVPTTESLAAYRVFGPDYYTAEVGPVRLVVLNTVVIDHPELVPDEWAAQNEFISESLVASGMRRSWSVTIRSLSITATSPTPTGIFRENVGDRCSTKCTGPA